MPETPMSETTILVVEDDPTVLEFATTALVRGGYTVLSATNGVEALEQIEQHKGEIHLVLSDIDMPKMDGIQLAKELKTEKPEIKILIMSGGITEKDFNADPDTKDFPFLQKPFDMSMMLNKVKETLNGSEQPSNSPEVSE